MASAFDDPVAFPVLSEADIAAVERFGSRRPIAVGDALYREGDAGYDFYVVIAGEVQITVDTGGAEQVVARYREGQFLGEIGLLTKLRVFVNARVTRAGEVTMVPRERFHHLIATHPRLGDQVLAAFIARRSMLQVGAATTTRVIGSRYSKESVRVREFLTRLLIPHEWLDPDSHQDLEQVLNEFGIDLSDLPVVVASGAVLRNPTPGTVAEYLGLSLQGLPERRYDLVVVGSGPAGLAASVYGASEGLSTLGVEGFGLGGQAGTTSRIENYLGFPLGISGAELAQRALVQAEKFGARMTVPCQAVSLREAAGHLILGLSDGSDIAARAVIAASGARYRRLSAARLDEFEDSNVYYAATQLEARMCGSAPVVVVGGGNSAGQAAMFLADSGNPVTLVIRSPDIAAHMSRYLVDRIQADPKITVRTGSQVTSLQGQGRLESVQVTNVDGHCTVECGAVFSFIGAEPASGWLSGCAALDDHGFVLTDRDLREDQLHEAWTTLGRAPLPYETNRPGLFAVGDVRSGSTKRVAAAVGEGSACVSSIHAYLAFNTGR
jgi:thioredoxin reductase (NADPH)